MQISPHRPLSSFKPLGSAASASSLALSSELVCQPLLIVLVRGQTSSLCLVLSTLLLASLLVLLLLGLLGLNSLVQSLSPTIGWIAFGMVLHSSPVLGARAEVMRFWSRKAGSVRWLARSAKWNGNCTCDCREYRYQLGGLHSPCSLCSRRANSWC